MPPLETGDLRQWAVYWPYVGRDNSGAATLGDPEEIRVRWEQAQREVLSNTEGPIAGDVIVVVNQAIEIGSQLRLGRLTTVPNPPDNLYEVISLEEIPDIKGRNTRRTVTLIRK